MIVVVEGIPGVGKSTLCKALARRAPFVMHEEPVHDDGLLDNYYRHPRAYALTFQLYVLMQRVSRHLEAQRYAERVHLFDRSLFGDLAIATLHVKEGNFTKEEATLYYDVVLRVGEHLKVPDVLVYMDLDTDVILERIKQRGRKAEERLSREWVEKLRASHEQRLEVIGKDPAWSTTKIIHLTAPTTAEELQRHLLFAGVDPKEEWPRDSG